MSERCAWDAAPFAYPYHRGPVHQLAGWLVWRNSGYRTGQSSPARSATRRSGSFVPIWRPLKRKISFTGCCNRISTLRAWPGFVLGPYWRVYLRNITGSRSGPEGAIVTSEIVRRAGGPPIKVEWRLGTQDGLYKASDVIIDGISMGLSERTEFASLIQRSCGQVQGLLAMMRDRAIAPASTPRTALPPSHGSTPPPR